MKPLRLWLRVWLPTVLFVACTSTPPSEIEDEIIGCTDSLALNYNELTTLDDGSCQYLGCTDATASNYDPNANLDDGNCVGIDEIPDGWSLVWNDEFNGDSIDVEKWNHEDWWPAFVNNELQSYSDDPLNSYLADGNLNIVMRKQMPFDINNPKYNSARMNTARKGDWTYGRFEIRAKLPSGQGMWPAIWMMPTYSVYGNWPVSGELDILELLGHEPNRMYSTIHYGDYYPNKSQTGTSYVLSDGSFADNFHVFVLEWEQGEIRWYVDGVLIQSVQEWFTVGGDWPAPFDQEFHLILNIALGGDWAGNPNESTLFPQSMRIDYVRVYQQVALE